MLIQDPLQKLMDKYPELHSCKKGIEKAIEELISCYQSSGKLLVCGNGGSAADSDHIVGELMKGFAVKRPLPAHIRSHFIEEFGKEEGLYIAERLQGALPAISLTSPTALITAFANDVDADFIYAQQVFGYGNSGDILIAISTSGNAENIIRALQTAKVCNMKTIGLTGRNGGRMVKYCDVAIQVPWDDTPDIQERHLPIYHTICLSLEKHFFS